MAPRSGYVYAINNQQITIFNAAFTSPIGFIADRNDASYSWNGIAFDCSGQVYVGTPNGTPKNSV